MHTLRYRQIHLDFHTSPEIPAVGAAFDPVRWQEALRTGHVNSITCFAVCHHGWSYFDTVTGKRHPNLEFDLLRAQFDACKEIGVNVPVYITAGVNNRVAEEHPEWREITKDGKYGGWTDSPLKPGFKTLCFNTPYTDYLCEQIREVAGLFPDCDGIFLDIIEQEPCCCKYCLETMKALGLDPEKESDRIEMSRRSLERYYRKTTAAARENNPAMPVFHNSGHIARGDRNVLQYFSHLELESLPTGGWGYDHFPVSAKYCKNLDLDFLGMTGKFHTTWGEFGGYKHPNALRYECAAMLAFGAKCSVGDQLHPSGRMDMSTYKLIGTAYAEVEKKEPWCTSTRNVADIALLSASGQREALADEGAARLLLEGHFLFDVVDAEMPFDSYKMLVIPDNAVIGAALESRLRLYIDQGGKIFLCGEAGVRPAGGFIFDSGAEHGGVSPYSPDYIQPATEIAPSFVHEPFVMYAASQRIRVTTGTPLGEVYDPYFNRTYAHFCSHQHTPPRPEASGFACGVQHGAVMYLAHPVFSLYRRIGAVVLKEFVLKVIGMHLDDGITLETNLPSTARVSLMKQESEGRYVLHLLSANTVSRGGKLKLSGGTVDREGAAIEVIEDLLPLYGTEIMLKIPVPVKGVTLQPQGVDIPFSRTKDGVRFMVVEFSCHQMIALQY